MLIKVNFKWCPICDGTNEIEKGGQVIDIRVNEPGAPKFYSCGNNPCKDCGQPALTFSIPIVV